MYVHFDNTAYLTGDTIWYKAYVVRASSLKPTTLSKVLYVELLNADGQNVVNQVLRIDSMGTAQGAIPLGDTVYPGYYEVRAYTREMVNWESMLVSHVYYLSLLTRIHNTKSNMG